MAQGGRRHIACKNIAMRETASRIPRVHVDARLQQGETLALPANAAHHLSGVLRQRVGDALVLFDGAGGEYAARITEIERNRLAVCVGAHHPVERESPLNVVLLQGISSGERMDFTVQKAVELGVSAIVPLICDKSVVRLSAERATARLAHWRRVVIAACEQCGRNRLPDVSDPVSVAHYCSRSLHGLASASSASSAASTASDTQAGTLRLLLSPEASISLRDAAQSCGGGVALAVGPESGFSNDEEAMLERAGFRPARIGPRILRTETAALAALSALAAVRGDF